MAILSYDGFDTYTIYTDPAFTAKWTANPGTTFTTVNGGRYSTGRAMSLQGSTSSPTLAQHKLPNITTVSFGFDYQYQSVPANTSVGTPLIYVYDNLGTNALRIGLTYNTYSMFWVYTIIDSSGANIATSSRLYNFNITNWHNMELEIVGSPTAGQIRMYVDGAKIIDVTNVNSLSSGRTYANMALCAATWSTGLRVTLYDNFYVTNTSVRLGEPIVRVIRPSADTATKQWTPSTGTTNFDKVNTTGYNNAQTTNVGSSVNAVDIYDMQDLPASGQALSKILAVSPKALNYKGSFGSVSTNSFIKINNKEFRQPSAMPFETQALSTLMPTAIYELNPDSNAAWTLANVNSLQLGINSSLLQDVVFTFQNGMFSNQTGSSLVSGDTAPTVSGDNLVFNGSSRIRYTDSSVIRAAPPFSVEFEFQTTTPSVQQILFNIGGDLNLIYPEMLINITSAAGIMLFTNPTNSNPNQSATFASSSTITANTWFKIGLMIYQSGSDVRARGYLNTSQVFDQIITLPYNSTTGSSIGASNGAGSYLNGMMRNITIGNSLFWPV